MTGDAVTASTQAESKPVRLLRATKVDDGYRLTVEGKEALIGEVRGQDFWNRKVSGRTTARAGNRVWELQVRDGVGLVATELGAEVARMGWTDDRPGRVRSFRRANPVGHLQRGAQPPMRLFLSPWQNLTRAQKRSAWVYGHWSLEGAGGVGVMNFGFSNRVATRIYVGVFPAGERDDDQLMLALLCLNDIWRWDEHGSSDHGVTGAGYW